MMIRVQSEPIDVGAETAALARGDARAGGIAIFVGRVRGDGGLQALTLEHYPGMTERAIERIADEARARWPILDLRILHRFGRLETGDAIVFVGVAAAHRGDAFEAARYVMDQVKVRAPFWKKEHHASGDRWVEARAADETVAKSWRQRNCL
jgi:molybdopterin synthase catalytic subunit